MCACVRLAAGPQVQVTMMTEKRIVQRPERVHLYRAYQATTSVWVPWPKRDPPVLAGRDD